MKNQTFVEYHNKNNQDQEKEELQFLAEDNRLQLRADLNATNRQIMLKERELLKVKYAKSFNTEVYLNCVSELTSLREGLAVLQALRDELYPDAETAE